MVMMNLTIIILQFPPLRLGTKIVLCKIFSVTLEMHVSLSVAAAASLATTTLATTTTEFTQQI